MVKRKNPVNDKYRLEFQTERIEGEVVKDELIARGLVHRICVGAIAKGVFAQIVRQGYRIMALIQF